MRGEAEAGHLEGEAGEFNAGDEGIHGGSFLGWRGGAGGDQREEPPFIEAGSGAGGNISTAAHANQTIRDFEQFVEI